MVGLRKYNGLDFQMDMLGSDKGDGSRVRPLSAPLPPQHAGGNRSAVVRPFIVKLRHNENAEDVDAPLSTVTTSGAHHMLCQPLILDHCKNGEAKPPDAPQAATGADNGAERLPLHTACAWAAGRRGGKAD